MYIMEEMFKLDNFKMINLKYLRKKNSIYDIY